MLDIDIDNDNDTPSVTDRDGVTTASGLPANLSFLLAAAIGGTVALSLGVYGRTHTPTGEQVFDFGFTTLIAMKAWLASVAAVLVLAQLTSALVMWGRLPRLGLAPATVATAHRWSGTIAFLFTLPVAYHCLWALGFQDTTTRVLIHSTLGCAFYGAIATKLLLLRAPNLPKGALPIVGGSLVVLLSGIWLTSSLWYFTTF